MVISLLHVIYKKRIVFLKKTCYTFNEEGANAVLIPKVYIETTLFNFYVDESRGDAHLFTLKLFQEIAGENTKPTPLTM